MPKCPKCEAELNKPSKEWIYRQFNVKMFKCSKCGNRYRQYYSKNDALKFVLSEHNKTLNFGIGRKKVKKLQVKS